jgi:hypothetical protein
MEKLFIYLYDYKKKLHMPEITYLEFVSIMIMSVQDAVCIVGKCW